jgi:hypothetical protein
MQIETLAETIGRLPLALAQATAYIHSFAVLSGIFANIFGQWVGLCKQF